MQEPTPAESIVVLFVTIDDEHADKFARAVVERRLVACVNLLPGVRSVYRWKGEVCEDTEVVLWMEAPAAGVEARIDALAALHPFDTPKIIALPPSSVHEPYRAWCVAQTAPTSPA